MDRRQMLDRAADALAAWNRGDAEAIGAFVAEDVIWRDVALGMPLHGRAALLAAAQAYMTAFPDLHIEVTSVTLDGPRLVQEWTVTGTHRGECTRGQAGVASGIGASPSCCSIASGFQYSAPSIITASSSNVVMTAP